MMSFDVIACVHHVCIQAQRDVCRLLNAGLMANHEAIKSVHFSDQCALCKSPYTGVAAHFAMLA